VRNFFSLTPAGIAALGDAAPPRWVPASFTLANLLANSSAGFGCIESIGMA
jgi:hypothetical protein